MAIHQLFITQPQKMLNAIQAKTSIARIVTALFHGNSAYRSLYLVDSHHEIIAVPSTTTKNSKFTSDWAAPKINSIFRVILLSYMRCA